MKCKPWDDDNLKAGGAALTGAASGKPTALRAAFEG